MNRYPKHDAPTRDAVPGWARVLLYIVAIVAPFAGLWLGKLDHDQTLTAVVTLFGIVGPAVAVVYERKQAVEQGAHFRAGYGAAVAEHVQGSQAVVVPDSAVVLPLPQSEQSSTIPHPRERGEQ